jgi:hypothetical protein
MGGGGVNYTKIQGIGKMKQNKRNALMGLEMNAD